MIGYVELLHLLQGWRKQARDADTSVSQTLLDCAAQLEQALLKQAQADSQEIEEFAEEISNLKLGQA